MIADSKKAKGAQRDKRTKSGKEVFSPGTLNYLIRNSNYPFFTSWHLEAFFVFNTLLSNHCVL